MPLDVPRQVLAEIRAKVAACKALWEQNRKKLEVSLFGKFCRFLAKSRRLWGQESNEDQSTSN